MCKCGVLSSVVIVSSFILVTSFNLDTFNYVQHKGPQDSMFGFSVAIHKEQGRSWVLVGAPAAQGRQSSTRQGGVVYKASATSDDEFDEIIFNEERSERGRSIDDKNYQWFGATVHSAGPDMPIVACAPRYVWFTLSREERRDPVGTCYVVRNNFRNSSEYSPCRTSLFGYHRQGSCQAGFSAGISKDGKRLFVGAPGSWYWQGQMYSIDPMIKFPFTPGIFGGAFGFGSGQVIQQSLDNRPAVMSTPEGPPKDDDSYMGYSMVVGDFNNEGVQGVAVGMPKGGEMLEGKVLLYTWSLTNYLNITGEQLGSYFGYALATSDVDGDRRDDLIIGAPLHTEKNTENKYEVGRVYIAYQGYDGSFTKKGYLDGINSKSRFGLSLCTLGDLNLDGYGDFAVGAPYDGLNERGAVYIFQGSAEGVIKKYSQVIYAEDMQAGGSQAINTFGFSITGGLDLDGNDYPDMAIGAYDSSTAYFFRARPVVKVEARVRFLTPNKQIFLDQRDCAKPGDPSIRVTCTNIELCMKYSGIGTPQRVEMDITYILDARNPKYSRMYLGRGPGKAVNASLLLHKDAQFNCQLKDTVYLEEQIVDKLTELEIEVKYSLKESGYYQQQFQRDPRSILVPIVDLSTPAVANDSISIYRNCGEDNQCIPNLRLIVEKKVDSYKYEIGKSIEFLVEVTNHAEDAYNSKFYIHLPSGIGFKVARKTDKSGGKIHCSQTFNESVFVCDIGNPLIRDTVMNFILEVEPLRQQQKLLKPTYFFYMNVTSVNPENPQDIWDNKAEIYMNVWVNAVLAIEGKSHPLNVYYNTSQYTEAATTWDTEIGPSVLHSYTVTNTGPADVQAVEIFILWPLSTLGGEDLLYLLEAPHTLGGVTCEAVDANHREFTLAVQRGVWETLGVPVPDIKPTQGGIKTENKTVRPGEAGNTITKTITTVTFYNIAGEKVAEEIITGEPTFDEYWKRISTVTKRFTQPLTVQSNSSTIIEKHINGKVVTQVSSRPLGIPSIPYTSYQIRSNITTTVTYLDAAGSELHKEDISEEPGSIEFQKRVKSTIDRFRPPPVTILTNTTRHILYTGFDGRPLYQEFLSQSGTETGSDIKTSATTQITTVTFIGPDGQKLQEEILTSEPTSDAFWKEINSIIDKYEVPVTIQTTTKKIVTFYVNGVEVNKEEVGVKIAELEAPLVAHVDIKTKLSFTRRDGHVLREEILADEPGTVSYSNHITDVISRYREPIIINANTTKTVRYRTNDGRVAATGYIYKYKMETHNPLQPETTRITTITTAIFYDAGDNIVHEERISAEPNTSEYWTQMNRAISRYQPANIHVSIKKYIVYYINNVEVRREETGGQTGAIDNRFTIHTETMTALTCTGSDGSVLRRDNIHGEIGGPAYNAFVQDVIGRYRQAITITANMTKTITYRNTDGTVVRTEHIYKQKTEHHGQNLEETTRISTITVITFYGTNGKFLQRETIMDDPGTEVYWDQVNKIITRYQEPVTIEVNTTKIIVYYSEGREVRTERISQPVDATESRITTRVDVTSTITCYGAAGNIVYTGTIPGAPGVPAYESQIATILQNLREPVNLHINIVRTITYYRSNGTVLKTGSTTEQRQEQHNPSQQPQTTRTMTVTTITFYGPDRNRIHEETISDEPGSTAYWAVIKNFISRYEIPLNVHTKIDKTIIYYVNGRESHRETVGGQAGQYETFATHIDVVNVITYYGSDGGVIDRETVRGELTDAQLDEYKARFRRRYFESFRMEVETKKTITYRSRDGEVLNNYEISEPNQGIVDTQTRKVEETTFTVYGPDRRTILRTETIRGGPGSEAFNRKLYEIMTTVQGSFTINTNTTITITHLTHDGRPINHETFSEPRSTIYRNEDGRSAVDATTYITFYGPDGQPIHQDSIHGAPTPQLYSQLDEIARKYGGVVKSYGGQRNEDGSIGGAVTVVDKPYPGNKPKPFREHFTEFSGGHGYNQSSQQSWRNQDRHNYGSSQSVNLQDLNEQNLGSYGRGKGFTVGGIDLGGNVDQYVDAHARSNFDRYSRSGAHSYDDSQNYLARDDVKTHKTHKSERHHRNKRQSEDDTELGIKELSNCKTSTCVVMRCTTGPMHKGHEVHIALRSRINILTLKNISTTQPVTIQSMLLARISQLQELSGPPANRTLHRHEVVTKVMAPQPDIKPDIVPLWVVILSAVAGTLILLLIVFLLHKAGFFRRSRPSDAPERQPLNRNGHFQHGDEAL